MPIICSTKCPWAVVAVSCALVILVTTVHVFMVPILPSSLEFSGARRSIDPSRNVLPGIGVVDSRLRRQFPSDSYGAVVFRGAPWKAEIGRWLAGCGAGSSAVNITEVIGTKRCEEDCSGHGVCNHDLGECRCFHGYGGQSCIHGSRLGKGCEEVKKFECNLPNSPEWPVGRWIVSICPAQCDKTRAMCFCGPGTKYPDRPVAEACGFKITSPAKPDDPKLTDWKTPDPDVFTANSSKPGWCNVDPEDAYSSKVWFKEECDCKYDGLLGKFCEIRVECTCINQCSGHGYCHGGFCQCNSGYFGIDCSIPSAYSLSSDWPSWLQPSTNLPGTKNIPVDVKAVVKKTRPLIYVYDLPSELDSHLLEGRHFRLECVNRIYDYKNRTIWTQQLYGAQIALYESILASPHRTLNGEEADFFYVPVLDSCLITRSDDTPHMLMPDLRLRSYHTLQYYRMAYDHIAQRYPYWNRTSGRDHIWFFSWDEGACYAPKQIWSSMMLVHWGNTNTKYENSTTAYWADKWDSIPLDRRGNHPCFDPKKDLVLPAWKEPNPGAIWLKLWERPRINRTTLFYFNGNLGSAYEKGRPEDRYSMGIRQKLAAEFGSTPDKHGKLGRQHTSDVTVTYLKTEKYYRELASSIFCGVLPGDGWSGRMEDSMLQGCIPVIIQDGIFLPYENVLNYNSFAVRIQEDGIPNLIKTLRGFNETQIEFMLGNVRKLWQRFFYRDSMLLEAERQKRLFSEEAPWSVEISKLGDNDDVFATFIQVLHYKLYNDPWRQGLLQEKETGLPNICLKAS